jgi:hypothetical protein
LHDPDPLHQGPPKSVRAFGLLLGCICRWGSRTHTVECSAFNYLTRVVTYNCRLVLTSVAIFKTSTVDNVSIAKSETIVVTASRWIILKVRTILEISITSGRYGSKSIIISSFHVARSVRVAYHGGIIYGIARLAWEVILVCRTTDQRSVTIDRWTRGRH